MTSRGSSPTDGVMTASESTAVPSRASSAMDATELPEKKVEEESNLTEEMQERLNKLKRLLNTSTAFSGFIADRMKSQKQQRLAEAKKEESPAKKNRNGKRQSDANGDVSPSKRQKLEGGTKDVETEGNTAMVKDEEIVYMKQPALITGATLRDYQLAGVQWLSLLYENGLNGILADEMGLGKTLQTIAFLAYLRERGVWGPFLVVCPLSVLHNWASEFEKFCPTVPVCIYHGTPAERKEIAATKMAMPTDLGSASSTPSTSRASTPASGKRKGKGKGLQQQTLNFKKPVGQTKATFPVVLTTYEMIIKDRAVLSSYAWSFVIIDEGHRLKNMESRLVQEIRQYPSANRLILTGTPLHNNLNELWSLLNFIMPKIFDDLSAFQAWFNPVGAASSSGMSQEQSAQLIHSLHSILKPFLLRRLKVDVEVSLPPKKEYILYAPLTEQQVEVYQSVIAGGRSLREWVVKKITGVKELDMSTRKALEDRKGTVEEAMEEIEDESITQAISKRRRTGTRKTVSYEGMEDMSSDVDSDEEDWNLPITRSEPEKSAAELGRDYAVKQAFSIVNNMHLQNKVMQLRKVCSHPFLFHWPNDKRTGQPVVSTELINASGKMLLLNRLLTELFARGHKVLIFSQFTSMLDIIQDWAMEFKKWDCCRIDGSTKNDERRDEMKRFNEGGDAPDACRLFLLSTRAGGLGVNLVAADTVIFYDSDWNPQMDLQAQDRAHRIGQTRPVLIFRLVSAHTVETRILERASEKRKLEALVIAKGKFKAVGSRASTKIDAEAIAASLLDLEGEKIDVVRSEDDKIISDADLDVLLDRSPEVFTERGAGWSKDTKEGAATKKTKGKAEASVAFKVFEREADELNDGLATLQDE